MATRDYTKDLGMLGKGINKTMHPFDDQAYFNREEFAPGGYNHDGSLGPNPNAFYIPPFVPITQRVRMDTQVNGFHEYLVMPKNKVCSLITYKIDTAVSGSEHIGPSGIPADTSVTAPSGSWSARAEIEATRYTHEMPGHIDGAGSSVLPPYYDDRRMDRPVADSSSARGAAYTGYTDAADGERLVTLLTMDDFRDAHGIPFEMLGMMLISNGGATSSWQYSQFDVDALTPDVDGNLVTSSGTLDLPGMTPIGVNKERMMRNIDGRYLNWKQCPVGSIYNRSNMTVPFINLHRLLEEVPGIFDHTTYGYIQDMIGGSGSAATNNNNPLYLLSKGWAFMYAIEGDSVVPGAPIYCDLHGNYVFNDGDSNLLPIGTYFTTDIGFPKQRNEMINTYPLLTPAASAKTGGLPAELFRFMFDFFFLARAKYQQLRPIDYLNMAKAGLFGMSNFNLLIN